MAQRRMIGQVVHGSGQFKRLSPAAQALFFQLWMAADDDGFVSDPENIVASLKRITSKHYQELIKSRYVLSFKNGVCCLKHFLMLNKIKKDRYIPTVYAKELESLVISPSREYLLKDENDPNLEPKCLRNGTKMEPKCLRHGSVDKDRIDKDSINKIDPRARTREGETDQIDLSSKNSIDFLLDVYMEFNPQPYIENDPKKVDAFLEKHTVDDFRAVIKKAAGSDYLSGRTGGPKMGFLWVLEEANFWAVMSGKYDSWKEAPEKADRSYDLDGFFEAAVSRGRSKIGGEQ